jgi:hypothetical protein
MTYQMPQPEPAHARKRKRVFMWSFLAVQGVFLAVLIAACAAGGSSGSGNHAQAVAQCNNGQWHVIYTSYTDCVNTLAGASDLGTGIGTAVIAVIVIGLWVATDVIAGITRMVVVHNRKTA